MSVQHVLSRRVQPFFRPFKLHYRDFEVFLTVHVCLWNVSFRAVLLLYFFFNISFLLRSKPLDILIETHVRICALTMIRINRDNINI